jgi:Ca-activated chloride channel family protein
MLFAAFSAAQLGGLFAVAGAVVVGLYILKLRRRTVAVPFAPLWQKILKDKEATSLFSRLKRLLSLLLQLALLAMLVLALGDPRAATAFLKGRNVVVLLDGSASMKATDVSPTRFAEAKKRIKTLIRGLGGSDRMLLVQMDATVTPLGPMSGDTSELERELDLAAATDTRADFPRALRFATDSLRDLGDPDRREILVVSDGALGPASDGAGDVKLGAAKLSFVPIGSRGENVGITQFAARRYPLDKSRYEVMLEVTNSGTQAQELELKLLGDKEVVDVSRFRIQPGEHLPRIFENRSGASRTLEAVITRVDGSHDDLPADDHAYALLPERRRAKVLVVTTGNTYLEAALLLNEYLDVTQVSPVDYATKGFAHAARGAWDAMIFDGVTPEDAPPAHALYIDPRGPGSPVKVEAALEQPGFDKIDRKHPIVRFTALDEVNIARGHKLVPGPGDKVVGASGEGGQSPILVAGQRGGYKFAALGFDVRDSDLPLRVAWPVFLLNTLNWFTDEDSDYLSSFRTGEVWRIPLGLAASGTDVTSATLKLPDGSSELLPVHEGRAVVLGQTAGFYELTAGAPGAEASKTSFAANLVSEEESAITPQSKLAVDGKEASEPSAFQVGVRREIWIYLLLLVALLTAVEWATYHRRVTV